MDQESEETLDRFTTRWVAEFGRVIEGLTGEEATLICIRAQVSKEAESMAECTWWKQSAGKDPSFSIWVGSQEPTWSALGATGEGGDPQAAFFEIVSQANQATVAALSAAFAEPLPFENGLIEAPTSRSDLQLCRIKISFQGGELAPLFLLMETSAFRALRPMGKDLAAFGAPHNAAILERLMDLQLPVSVLLGRAAMKIKDVLKVTPGSVIELDRQIGDFVEIMVHGTVVARGEIVSIKGNYGVRIKEIISRQDRLALHEAA